MKTIKLLTILGIIVSALSLSAKMPENTYACHVTTDENEMGIAFLQADTKAIAERDAINRSAFVTENRTQTTIQVIECVQIPGNKLSDPVAQQLLESIPR